MRITIDNEDGRGAVDYTAAVATAGPITIVRALNAPQRCMAEFMAGQGLPIPARRGRVVVSSDAGVLLFTGYLATEPVSLYAGMGVDGPAYRLQVNAVSDEWLLDKQGSGASAATDGLAFSTDGQNVIGQMTQVVQAGQVATGATVSVAEGTNARALGAFAVQPDATWSSNAGAAANATYATYRTLNGSVSVAPAGATVHTFSDADGSLNPGALSAAYLRELANDVTISGLQEATTYVQEIFQGDGTTTDFMLTEAAFRGANRTLIRDSFDEAVLDSSQWLVSDPGGHLVLSGAGLTVNGGNGFDGQAVLQGVHAVEMSGFVLTELGGVTFGAGSDGVLAGFYNGSVAVNNCFAGFRVRQSVSSTAGATVVVPLLNGTEVGTTFTPIAGHTYTLRVRLYCAETQRVPQRYYCMVDGAVQGFGAVGGVAAPMQLVLEIVDEGVSSNTPATVLYDTAQANVLVGSSPATCTFAAVNAISLFCALRSARVTRPGGLWVVSTLPNGTQLTRLIGSAGQGVDCKVDYGSTTGSAGKVSFFVGRTPTAGERLTVCYRTQRRAVARLADSASIAAESAAGVGVQVPGVSRWLGKVVAPPARSSMDCEAAAQAVLAMATARSAALNGTYITLNPTADIWPGDLLQVVNAGTSTALLVRNVIVEDGHAVPELLRYKVGFANDWATEWADGLGLKLSDTVASDGVLPAKAASGPDQVMTNLQQMTVTMLSGSAIQIDAGLPAPAGGGFEVRRRDWDFGEDVDMPDLVLRSPVCSFSILRAAQNETYYVRMYDGSTPPVYSRFSSALVVHWPTD